MTDLSMVFLYFAFCLKILTFSNKNFKIINQIDIRTQIDFSIGHDTKMAQNILKLHFFFILTKLKINQISSIDQIGSGSEMDGC
jgi:hypothetical protein